MNLPQKYKWLLSEPGPKMILEGLKIYGIKEIPGEKSNAIILGWAKEFDIEDIYTNDDVAWCALAHAHVAKAAGKEVPYKRYELLRAKSWMESFGEEIDLEDAMLGDTVVFKRPGGYHVAQYIGEDKDNIHCLGGNQSNAYNITRIPKIRLVAVRRPLYKNKPANIRKIHLEPAGEISVNEA